MIQTQLWGILLYIWRAFISIFGLSIKSHQRASKSFGSLTLFLPKNGRFLAMSETASHSREYFSLNIEWIESIQGALRLKACGSFLSLRYSCWSRNFMIDRIKSLKIWLEGDLNGIPSLIVSLFSCINAGKSLKLYCLS